MVTRILEDFVVEGSIVFKPDAAIDPNELLRQLVRQVGAFAGQEFVPRGKRSVLFMNGEGVAGRVLLGHPKFTEEQGYAGSWLSISLDIEKERGFVFLAVHMGQPGEQIEVEWNIGLEIMPRLLTGVPSMTAFLNGRLVEVESSEFPSEQPLLKSGLPKVFTPWTFFADEKLDTQMRKKLSELPVVSSAPIANGWAVQAVETLTDPPSPDFLAALETLADEPIRYVGPVLNPKE